MHRIRLIRVSPAASRDVVRRGTVRLGDTTGPALKRKPWQPITEGTRHLVHRHSSGKDVPCPQVPGIPAAPVEEGSSDRQRSLGRPYKILEKPWLWPSAFPPWQWGSSLTWRSACLFFMGSILFTLSCSTGLFQIMASHSLRNRLCVAYPYAAGSLLYTWGAYSTMVASVDALRHLELQGGATHVEGQTATSGQPVQLAPAMRRIGAGACIRSTASRAASGWESGLLQPQLSASCSTVPQERLSKPPKSFHKACTPQETHEQSLEMAGRAAHRRKEKVFNLQLFSNSAHGWATVDLAGAVIVWIGTLLYNSSCITPAILATLTAPLPASTMAAVLHWAVKVPNIVAGCFFVTGSYAAWTAASRSPNLLHVCRKRLPSGSFWAFLLYLLGSVGFLTGAVLTEPLFILFASVLIDEWFGMFVGYFLGSLCFLSGSYLAMTTVT